VLINTVHLFGVINGVLGCFYVMERKKFLFCLRINVFLEDLIPGIALFLC